MKAFRSVLLIASSNLRRRRGQGLLVGSILGLSALLFFTGVGVLREIGRPVLRMLERQRASHFTLAFDARIHDPEAIRSWWIAQPGIIGVSEPLASIELRESSFFRGTQLSRFISVTERPAGRAEQDLIRIVEGRPAASPGPGEIWLPTSLAADAGVRAGDTLEIPAASGLVPLLVSAIVVDPQYSAPFTNPVRVWVAAGELPRYFQSARLTRVMIGIRLAAGTAADPLWAGFLRSLGGAYSGASLDQKAVLAGYTAPYSIMAGMIVAFSALGFFVALFAMQGTVASSILADFKTIGILRAQGFRPVDVERGYQLQYLILAAVALPIGLLLGIAVVGEAVALLTKPVATPVEAGGLALLAAATLPAFLLLVSLFVSRVARAAGRIRPADAIRYGAAATEGAITPGISLRRLGRFSVPIIVAIRNLSLQKRRAAFLAVAVLFATVAASLAINLDHSFGRMTTDLASFGFDAADVRVSRVGRRFGIRHADLMAALASRPGVQAVATWDGIEATFPPDSAGATRIVAGTVVDGDMAGLQYANLRGRNPVGPGEMSIGIRSASELGLDLGSKVEVFLMGAPITLEVVGIYQSINNTGHGFRIRLEPIRLANPLWSPSEYGIALAPGVDRDRFIAELESEYGEAVDAKPGDFFIRDQLASIVTGMRMTNGFLAAVFLLAAAVFIINTTLLTIAENRRIFGILKTTGMTPGQLRWSVVAGVAIQSAGGVGLGLLVWFGAAPLALSGLFSVVGLASFPLVNSGFGMAAMVPVVFGFCLASAWVPSRRVLDANPRALIVE